LSDCADTRSYLEGRTEGASEHITHTSETLPHEVQHGGEDWLEKLEDSHMETHSEKSFQELQARCKKLEADVAKKNRNLKSAQYGAAAARKESQKVIAKHAGDLKEALKYQRQQLNEEHVNGTSELEKRLSSAAKENQTLKKTLEERLKKLQKSREKAKLLLEERTKIESTMRFQEREISLLKQRQNEIWDMYREQKDRKAFYKGEVEILQKNMDEELAKREPLVHIGAAVRMRSLEQFKYQLGAQDRSEVQAETDDAWTEFGFPNRQIIEKGNDAAHNGNSEADAALFKLSYYDDSDDYDFLALYNSHPEKFQIYKSSHFVRILDCIATTRSFVPVNKTEAFEAGKTTILNQLSDIARDMRADGNDRYWSERGCF